MSSKSGFLCKWTVENFSFNVKEILSSPSFTVTLLKDTRWNLCLLKETFENELYIVCMLKRNNDKGPSNIKLFYEISIMGPGLKLETKYVSSNQVDFQTKTCGSRIFLISYNRYKEKFIETFKKESFTVYCRMWNPEIGDAIEYCIRTPVKTHKRYFKKELENFAPFNRYEYLLKYSEKDTSAFHLIMFGKAGTYLEVFLLQIQPYRRQHVKCRVSVLDGEGKMLSSPFEEIDFETKKVSSTLYYVYKDLCLPDNTLSVLVEMQVSGAGDDGMEQINFGDGLDQILAHQEGKEATIAKSDSSTENSLMGNLLNFYKDGTLCDVVLKTDNSSFPVHKVILCAQSPVFTAMLESDLKEKQTGTIPIPNMSDDTVQKMILFMYTDQVEDLDVEGALNLYFAADQYNIAQLKRLCRDFLKSNLDSSNVTDVLFFADLHQDEDLKTTSHDFIFEHDEEVIASDKWNKFMEDHLKLAAETTHLIYRRKLKK